MQPEVNTKVRFLTTAEGGRRASLKGGVVDFYAVLFVVDDEAFECRVLRDETVLELGHAYDLQVKFMNWALVGPKLTHGKSFKLYEGKKLVAVGRITGFLNNV